MDDGKIVLTHEQLKEKMLPYVKTAWKEAQDFLSGKKKELGSIYNHRNMFEMVRDRFGNAAEVPEKYVNEYILIQNKASRLPASVRMPIQQIGARALNLMLLDMKESLSPGNNKPDWANGVQTTEPSAALAEKKEKRVRRRKRKDEQGE